MAIRLAPGAITATELGVPAGNDKDVQFNDGGTLAGLDKLKFDKTAIQLRVNTDNVTSSTSHVYIGDNDSSIGASLRVDASNNGMVIAINNDSVGISQYANNSLDINFGNATLQFADGGPFGRVGAEVCGRDSRDLVLRTDGTDHTKGVAAIAHASQTAAIFQVRENNGTVRVSMNPGGNVGIGTASPSYKLDVQENAAAFAASVTNAATNGNGLLVTTNGTSGLAASINCNSVSGAGLFINIGSNITNAIGLEVRSLGAGNSTAPLADFIHYGSALSGDSLKMDLASGSGSFTGNFLNCLVNSVLKFKIAASGAVTIADGSQSNGFVLTSDASGNATWAAAPTSPTSPSWTKVTLTYADFATTGNTNSVNLYSLVAGGTIHGVKIKQSSSFTGGTISAYTISVGLSGANDKYASAFNVFQAPGDTVFENSQDFYCENQGAATQITASASSTGDTLDNATAGSVDIWLLVSTAS